MPRVKRSPPQTTNKEKQPLKPSHIDKSLSDTDTNSIESKNKSSPNYMFMRKRTRDDMDDSIGKQLDEFRQEMRKMLNILTDKHEKDIQQISSTLKEIQQSNISIENSITFLTAQNENLQKKISLLECQAKEDKKCITILQNRMEDFQIHSRKSNFVLRNVPCRNNETKEDLIEMIMCLSRSIDCNINRCDIGDIYRSNGRNNEKRDTPIIVETSSTLIKTKFLKMGKAYNIKHKSKLCCKQLGFHANEDTPIFLSEHLTPKGSRLHFLARDLTRSGLYKFCWTAYGKVYVRKDEQSQIITIRSEDQIHQLKLLK